MVHVEQAEHADLAELRERIAAAGQRFYLGVGTHRMVFSEPEQAVLVLGPPRSGKTTSLVIPNVLAAPGPVVVTSTKGDVMAATWAARSRLGKCWLFDPSQTVPAPEGVRRISWSPVSSSRSWEDALLVTRAMVSAARPPTVAGESGHWSERAEALLAPLFHAAAISQVRMDMVLDWVNRQELTMARAALSGADAVVADGALAGIEATDGRELSGIWSTAAGVLAAYRSTKVLGSDAQPNFNPAMLHSTNDTVYVCSPAAEQSLMAPVVVAFLEQIRTGTYRAAAAGELRVGLTLALDELANIAPLPGLASLVSEGGSQGVMTLACLQDLSQARSRWGSSAEGFLTLFGTKVILPGVGDLRTLDLVSQLSGTVEVPVRSVSRRPWWVDGGAPTVSWSSRQERRLPVHAVAQQQKGTALLIDRNAPPVSIGLTPWFATPPFDLGRVAARSRVDPPENSRRLRRPTLPGLS